jgi:hypothetical protein
MQIDFFIGKIILAIFFGIFFCKNAERSGASQSLSISHSVCSKTRIQSTSRSCFGAAVGVALEGKKNTHDANLVTLDHFNIQ